MAQGGASPQGGANAQAGAGAQNAANARIPPELAAKLQNADVTTITDTVVEVAGFMYTSNSAAAMQSIHAGLAKGISGVDKAMTEMGARPPALANLESTMVRLNSEIDPAFAAAAKDYQASVEASRPRIVSIFQSALNTGFAQMYFTVMAAALAGAVILGFYGAKKDEDVGAEDESVNNFEAERG